VPDDDRRSIARIEELIDEVGIAFSTECLAGGW
jgi:hypothetical protein